METATTDKVTEITKNTTEIIRVQPTVFNSVELIDARVWRKDPTGEKRPTKKGLSLRPEVWPKVIVAIQGLLPCSELSGGKPADDDDEFGPGAEGGDIFSEE